MASAGPGGDADAGNVNQALKTQWEDAYRQIFDEYKAGRNIKIEDKNYGHHLAQGKTDGSKSVVTRRVDENALCKEAFLNYTASAFKVPSDKNRFWAPRIFIAAQFDRYIGWANYIEGVHHHTKANEDSRYFLGVYQKNHGYGNFIVLSLQVSNRPFLTSEVNSDDTYIVRSDEKDIDHTTIQKLRRQHATQ